MSLQFRSSTSPTSLERFVTTELADLNEHARDGSLSLSDWVTHVVPSIADIQDQVRTTSNADARQRLRRLLGIVAISAEANAQRCGLPVGAGLQRLPGADVALLLLAGRTAPPLTAWEFWMDTDPLLNFTHDQFPTVFRDAVRTQVTVSAEINAILRRIIDGEIDLASPMGTHFMRLVGELLRECGHAYRRLDKETRVDAAANFQRFRTWLAPSELFGTRWTGPNAAALSAMTDRDLLLGTASEYFTDYLRDEIYSHLTVREQSEVDEDLRRGSVMGQVVGQLGYESIADFILAKDTVERVHALPNAFAMSMSAYATALQNHYLSSGPHTALVKTRLATDIDDTGTTDQIHAGVGVSGRPHSDHLHNLADMRRSLPAVVKLKDVVVEVAKVQAVAAS